MGGILSGRANGNGTGGGAQPVLAVAAVLDDADGRLTLSSTILSLGARSVRRGDGPLDVVLVTRDAAYALLLRLPPEFRLAGVVAEREMGFAPPIGAIVLITGVEGVLSAARDGDWMILEPGRGRVVLDPLPAEIARLQGGHRSRPSYLLGAEHTPAQTLLGRTVAVWSTVRAATDINAALLHGADGILLDEDSELISDFDGDDGAVDSDELMYALLAQAADAFGGGDVCICAGADRVHPRTIVRLAARCRLSWALDPGALPERLTDMFSEMNQMVDAEEDAGSVAALPRLCALVRAAPAYDGADDFTLIDFEEALWSGQSLPSSFGFLPPVVRVRLASGLSAEERDAAVSNAVALGAIGIVVAPHEIESTKDAVRVQD
jgi:hypothetical protein